MLKRMGVKVGVLAGLLGLMAAVAPAPQPEAPNADAAKGIAKALESTSKADNAAMGHFVLEQIEAGKSGEELAAAIKEKKAALGKKAAEAKAEDEKAKEDKVKAKEQAEIAKAKGQEKRAELAKKHGLADDDFPGLGKFVNQKHEEGLKGEELSAAIKEEINRRKAIRQEAAAAKKEDKAKDKGQRDDDGKPDQGKNKDKDKDKDKSKDQSSSDDGSHKRLEKSNSGKSNAAGAKGNNK